MPAEDESHALQRILRAHSGGAGAGGASPARVLRVAVARAAREAAGLLASVTGHRETSPRFDALAQGFGEDRLVFLIEGAARVPGLAVLDGGLVAALIEQLTTGRVVAAAPAPRAPTPTDAALIRPFLQALFNELAQPDVSLPVPAKGFRPVATLRDGPAIFLALEDVRFWQVALQLDLAGGAKQGELRLVLPHESGAGRRSDALERGRRHALASIPVALDAVLARISLPLAEFDRLGEGTSLPVPREALQAVEVVAGGNVVGRARLGQQGGNRAIRINAPEPLPPDSPSAAGEMPSFAAASLPQPGAQPAVAPDASPATAISEPEAAD